MTSPTSGTSRAKKRVARTVKPRGLGSALGGFLGAIAMSVIAGVLITAAVTPVVAVTGAAGSSLIKLFEDLPDHINPGALAQPSTIYAKTADGKNVELAQFYLQNREQVGWDQVSQYVKDAAVSEEDPRYYTHNGVDVFAAARAVLQNVVAGGNASGASTITMQYVRNILVQESEAILDPAEAEAAYDAAMEESMDRKLKEMRLAISIEKQFSKDEILLSYLNIANYGGQTYGIESAAQYYYGKSAKDVSLAEAASLVAIVNYPTALRLDREDNIEANKDRRDLILHSMLKRNRITQAQYDEAIATPIETKITPRETGCAQAERNYGLGHFCNYVQLQILHDEKFGATADERFFNLQRGGYSIYTTVDLDMQAAGNEAIRANVPQLMDGIKVGAAASTVQPKTGRILAMAQNQPFSEDPAFIEANPGYTSINYNTDYDYGGSSGFQVGSTSKAWTLAEWIRTGHSVNDIVNANQRTVDGNTVRARCMPGGVYGGQFNVGNHTNQNYGNISVLRATTESINAGYMSMQQKMDLCDTMDMAEKLGVHRASKMPNENADNYNTTNLSIVPSNIFAGTDEIAPMTMATAYAAFANEGVTCTPTAIDSIKDLEGQDVDFTKSKCTDAVSPEVAAGVLYAFEQGVQSGLASFARSSLGVPHFAKTGTTDNWVDNWVVGGSTTAVTSVWVGNVVGKVSTFDFGGYWGLTAAKDPIFSSIMYAADARYGGDAFPAPSANATKRTMAQVPDVTGMSFDEAKKVLEQVGFQVEKGDSVDSSKPKDTVARTDPSGGSEVGAGSSITIFLSNGKAKTIPDGLVGLDGNTAKSMLQAAGFSDVRIDCNTGQSNNPGGQPVVSVDPASGTEVNPNKKITLTVDCAAPNPPPTGP